MNVNSIGSLGIVATSQAKVARGGDADRAAQEVRSQQRQAASEQLAEAAGGIGEMQKDSEAGDRDADGRQLLMRPRPMQKPHDSDETSSSTRNVDPTGILGSQLDLSG